jgi:2-haloacid dehalogenase
MEIHYGLNATEAVSEVKALLFDTFGTLVDWRSSLIGELIAYGRKRGISADWTLLVDKWRSAYYPSMDRVRKGEQPWTTLDVLHRQSLERLVKEQEIHGISEGDLDEMTRTWHRLRPWPDVLDGMRRLATRYLLGSLSNGNVSLLVHLRKFSGLPWDVILGADLWQHYKPDPETYQGACRLLDLRPEEVMLVAAHNDDLRAARAQGLRTAFIPRPVEYGPGQVKDFEAEEPWTVVALDLIDLARLLST